MIRAKGAYNGQVFRIHLEPGIRLEDLLSIVSVLTIHCNDKLNFEMAILTSCNICCFG